jgi:hypothetical protein
LDGWPCSSEGCENDAEYAITFTDQSGHVHDCGPHTAMLREWTDIERVTDLPCQYTHGGMWTDSPRPL